MNTDLVTYYKERAEEYEKVYYKPERQKDLLEGNEILQNIFTGKNVLEIACGTGYWTERIAKVATSILATDINQAVIDVAKRKTYAKHNVSFALVDIFNLPQHAKYESLFAGFLWSHIKLEELDGLLTSLNRVVEPGGTVVFMDNRFVDDSNHPISHTDENGNTFQTRKLENGTQHMVLKNFPTEDFLHLKLTGIATDVRVMSLDYYWILSYKTPVN